MPETARPFGRFELWVLAMLRVPPNPQPPEGSPDSIQVFQAGRNYYTWRLLVWGVSHLLILIGLLTAHLLLSQLLPLWPGWAQIAFRSVERLALLAFAALLLFTFFAQRLNFILRWYIVTDRSLRIRTGVVRVQELTITFANIQEIRLSAGPLQNLLGLADVEVHSAGGGSAAKGRGGGHIARFEAVSNANAIRDLIVERLRRYRDSGLGEVSPESGAADRIMDAARAVLTEARALRARLAG